jgi:acyl carrier protein
MVDITNIEEQVFHILSVTLNIPVSEINSNSSMKTIREWDSLGHLNIVEAMEEYLEIELTLDELSIISSVQDWIDIFIKYQQIK